MPTVLTRAELAQFFILAGLITLIVKAPPAWLKAHVRFLAQAPAVLPAHFLRVTPSAAQSNNEVLLQILLFFTKAGAFVFGSGLAVVPSLYQGVVQDFHWLTEQQFTDAVAVAMITPGPVVITVALSDSWLPDFQVQLWPLLVFPARRCASGRAVTMFKRHGHNAQLKGFVASATAAAAGPITGSLIILGQRASST